MAFIKAFRGLRPSIELVAKVAELPYDVVSSEEARDIAEGNQFSFFHISKPEIDLDPGIKPYNEDVYTKGKYNLSKFIEKGILKQDRRPMLYLYTQVMEGRSQTGLVACVNIDDYVNNIVKKHELTREDKENDRTKHLDKLNANTGPVFLFYSGSGDKKDLFDMAMKIAPEYDFTARDGIRHILRVIESEELIIEFVSSFRDDVLYIADGHHRAASAVRVGLMRRERNRDFTGDEEFNWFLGVIFPHSQLRILPYNRIIRDLHGNNKDEFLSKLSNAFSIDRSGRKLPMEVHTFSMYIAGEWYTIIPKFEINSDPIESLDVTILQNKVFEEILGIQDPRKDTRIEFIGGIRGTGELEKLVDSGDYSVAFSMYPTSVEQLIHVSDSNNIMPPKSTWFEPKLRSGIVLHLL